MKTMEYDKLVRDRIPEIIEKSGKKVIVEKVEEEEFLRYLNVKLEEELEEYRESGQVEELADMVEVIYGIISYKGLTIDKFDEIRRHKKLQRGGFEKGLVLKKVIEDGD